MTMQETSPTAPQRQPEIQPSSPVPDKRTSPQHGIQTEGTAKKQTQQMSSDRLRRQWPDFSDDDINAIDGNKMELKSRLKKVYGFSEERAEKEYRTFMTPYESSFEPAH